VTSQVDQATLAAHLDDLARIAQIVAEDLRNSLAYLREAGPAGSGGEAAVNHDLMTAEELAGALRIDIRTLRRRRHQGRIPKPLRGKGPLRWSRAAVARWMQEAQS
jgi:hypothetical protein